MPQDKENKQTSEEKLLKVIENPDDASVLEQKQKYLATNRLQKAKQLFNIKFLLSRLSFKNLKLSVRKFSLEFKHINQALAVLAVFLIALSIWDFNKGRVEISKHDYLKEGRQFKEDWIKAQEKYRSESYYLQVLDKRNFFVPYQKKKEELVASASKSEALSMMVQNLKVVGIMWSDNPQVIIEDGKDNATHLLRAGDKLGEITIKEVLKDRAVLEYQGAEMDLL